MEFRDYLKIPMRKDGSDIYLTAGAPPGAIRRDHLCFRAGCG